VIPATAGHSTQEFARPTCPARPQRSHPSMKGLSGGAGSSLGRPRSPSDSAPCSTLATIRPPSADARSCRDPRSCRIEDVPSWLWSAATALSTNASSALVLCVWLLERPLQRPPCPATSAPRKDLAPHIPSANCSACRRRVKANPLSAVENGPTFQDREGVEGGGLGGDPSASSG
jgi:hypothetical protein